jgi:hypothetical protein
VFKAGDRQLPYVLIGDEVWFPATQVAEVLGYKNTRDAILKHCDTKGVAIRDVLTEGGLQEQKLINEPNLYRLILKSKLPGAVEFQTWVCAVLFRSWWLLSSCLTKTLVWTQFGLVAGLGFYVILRKTGRRGANFTQSQPPHYRDRNSCGVLVFFGELFQQRVDSSAWVVCWGWLNLKSFKTF